MDAGSPASGSQLGVVRRIYYPATGRGYVFQNYSGHGMAKKISQRIGMTAASDRTEVAYTEYTYADTGALNDSPQFTERKEWWQGKTDGNGTPDSLPTTYTYSRSLGVGTEINTVGYPNNLDVVTTSDNDQFSPSYGKVLDVVYKNHTTGAALRELSYSYVFPSDGGIQIGTVNTWDDVLNRTRISYDYSINARLTNVYEYGLRDSGSFKVRRRTSFSYSDDAGILGASMYHLVTQVKVYDALFDNDDTNDVLKAKTIFSYDNYAVKGGMEYYGLSSGSYPPNHDSAYDQNKTARGNLTGVQTFSSLNPDVSTNRYSKYDIFGSVVNADVSCCQVKTFTFNSTNYYSQPVSVTSGTPGVVPFLTTNYVYDFNTGLTTQTTDPHNLTTNFAYDTALRLKQVSAPSGAVTTTSFDKDANQNDLLSYTKQVSYFENGGSKVITNKTWFDGAGHPVRSGSGAGASPTTYDVAAAVYDNMGRPAKQSNPYAGDTSGNGTASYWTANVYDELSRVKQITLPDGQTMTTTYSGVTTTVTDQVGRKRQNEVDGLGRLVKVIEQNPATGLLDATNYLTSYTYDVLDNLLQVNQVLPSS